MEETTNGNSSAELLGSLTSLADPESEISQMLNLGSAFMRFSEVISRFFPL